MKSLANEKTGEIANAISPALAISTSRARLAETDSLQPLGASGELILDNHSRYVTVVAGVFDRLKTKLILIGTDFVEAVITPHHVVANDRFSAHHTS